jgi:hydroxymethylbilane synthase
MSGREIVVGTRGSRLALAQAELVVTALHRAGRSTRISIIETAGDRRAPDTAWGEGAFVAAIERALLACEVDVAVHSAKDVPTDEDSRLRIGAYLPRADPRDALVVRAGSRGRGLDGLSPGTRVGTDSPRRTAFVLARRPDLVVHPLHGNVDTRLRRLDEGETDALVLACAGLDRLGLGDRIAERIEPDVVPPAPGQGAIAVQVRRDDMDLIDATTAIDDPDTRVAVEAERAFLAACGGGCRSPIGALGNVADGRLTLLGGMAGVDGSGIAIGRRRGRAVDGVDIARGLAEGLDRGMNRPSVPRVLVTRSAEQAGELIDALRERGLEPVSVPAIEVERIRDADPLADPPDWGALEWIVVTSTNGVRAALELARTNLASLHSVGWAAIGAGTAALLAAAGVRTSFQPSRSGGAALAAELPVRPGDRVLVIRGDLADGALAETLRGRGAVVDDLVAYRTQEAPTASRTLLREALLRGTIDAIAFTSGSTVRGLVALARSEDLDISAIPAVCIGPETADAARDAGFTVVAVPDEPSAVALADAAARALLRRPLEVR